MSNSYRLTFGADPEFFVVSENGDVVPGWHFTEGTKQNPIPIEDLGEGFAMHYDGPAIEFAVPPARDHDELMANVEQCREWFNEVHPGYLITDDTDMWFDEAKFSNDVRFNTVGCDQDINAFTGEPNPAGYHTLPRKRQSDGKGGHKAVVLRSGGGHIHIGVDPWPQIPKNSFARLVSAIWGFTIATKSRNSVNGLKVSPYRANGLYREKPYGIEFRSPANNWLRYMSGGTVLGTFTRSVSWMVKILHEEGAMLQDLLAAYKTVPWQDLPRDGMTYWDFPQVNTVLQRAIRGQGLQRHRYELDPLQPHEMAYAEDALRDMGLEENEEARANG